MSFNCIILTIQPAKQRFGVSLIVLSWARLKVVASGNQDAVAERETHLEQAQQQLEEEKSHLQSRADEVSIASAQAQASLKSPQWFRRCIAFQVCWRSTGCQVKLGCTRLTYFATCI